MAHMCAISGYAFNCGTDVEDIGGVKTAKSSDYLPRHSWPSLQDFLSWRSIANSLKICSPLSFSLSCVS
jgi:hypothetical protein